MIDFIYFLKSFFIKTLLKTMICNHESFTGIVISNLATGKL